MERYRGGDIKSQLHGINRARYDGMARSFQKRGRRIQELMDALRTKHDEIRRLRKRVGELESELHATKYEQRVRRGEAE